MNRVSIITEDKFFGTTVAMDKKSCLVFNLTQKTYERKTLYAVMQEGLRVTQNKLKVEIEQEDISRYNEDDDHQDLLKFYGTDNDEECAILMPVPNTES